MIILFLLSLAGVQVAGNWTLIHETISSKMYLDVSSVKEVRRDIRSAWVRRQNDPVNDAGISFEVMKMRFDCANEESGIMSFTYYDANGQAILYRDYNDDQIEMTILVPGTSGIGTLNAVCSVTI